MVKRNIFIYELIYIYIQFDWNWLEPSSLRIIISSEIIFFVLLPCTPANVMKYSGRHVLDETVDWNGFDTIINWQYDCSCYAHTLCSRVADFVRWKLKEKKKIISSGPDSSCRCMECNICTDFYARIRQHRRIVYFWILCSLAPVWMANTNSFLIVGTTAWKRFSIYSEGIQIHEDCG